ncbi:terminal uridylyltransferase Tailor-like [Drosophila takahashii]|uniref:terminal uridylyltransferase Tailor-like n=1 Tax=Drosophila takahashii TaxID=29030 RepID=UPI001CF85956|nr:terminal uridylyltransferase Tailor-like isoform X2 [Drosophila takahashii]
MNDRMCDFWDTLLRNERRANKQKNNVELNQKIITDLLETLCPEFPSKSIQVHPFGSRILGMAGPDSDLDLYVDIGNSSALYSETLTDKVIQEEKIITKALQKNPSKWAFLANVEGHCPVIVARHKNSNIQCDISFSNSMICGQSKLVIYIFELQPIARLMIIYLRGWVKELQIQSAFRSHLLVLMVIFFLQVRGYLPTVYQFQDQLIPDVGPIRSVDNQFL